MKKLLLTNLLLLLSVFILEAQDQATCEISGDIVTVSGNPTACAGSSTGEATVASTGCSCMFSGCTYTWSDGQTFHTAFNLEAGTYQVTVTHPPDSLGNICEVTVEVIIEEGEEMIDNVDQIDVSCKGGNDGSVTIVPSLFAGQLNYQWSTGDTTATVNGLSAGTYGVVVSNFENCFEEIVVEVAEPETSIEIENIDIAPACGGVANGAIAVSLVNTNNFTVTAIDGDDEEFTDVSALMAGFYEVFIIDENGCSTSEEVTIEEGDLQFDLISSTTSACAGSTVTLEAQTPQDATFMWSGGSVEGETSSSAMVTLNETTTYSVYVETAEGCSATQEITIEIEAAPEISFLYNGELNICEGDVMNMVVSVPEAINYAWEPSAGVSGTNAVYLNPSETTTYTVTATLANGCVTSNDFTLTVEDCGTSNPNTSIGDIDVLQNIFPNPSSNGIFQVNTTETIKNITVYDISGKLVKTEKTNGLSYTLDLSNAISGIYFLHIATNNGTVIEKLLKQ